MKTARNITLVSLLLAAGVMSVPACAHDWVGSSAVKATVTFTEPNQHGYDFAAQTTSGVGGAVNSTQHTKFVGTKEKLDWALGLEHRLVDTSWTRLFLDYDHYETDESSRLNTLVNQQVNLLGVGAAGSVLESFGQYDIDADSVKLGARHRVNHSARTLVDLGAALSWVDVDRDFVATQTNGTPLTRTLRQEAEFEGFGPYFDVTVKHFANRKNRTGFNLQMYAGAGLMYAETHFKATLLEGTVVQNNFDREKVKGVSSELMAKLAIGWDYRMCNRSTLSTTLGYMFMHYSDAFGGQTAGSFNRAAITGFAGAGNASSGIPFTRQGPFLEFKWSGAHF